MKEENELLEMLGQNAQSQNVQAQNVQKSELQMQRWNQCILLNLIFPLAREPKSICVKLAIKPIMVLCAAAFSYYAHEVFSTALQNKVLQESLMKLKIFNL